MALALETLGAKGMSEDEISDDEGAQKTNTRRIMSLEWRSPAVSMWLRSLDAYYKEYEEASFLLGARDGRGGRLYTRNDGGRQQPAKERAAVLGLHPAAYRKEWLDKIGQNQLLLEMNSKGFDFSVLIPRHS